jgi:hypothetical protein
MRGQSELGLDCHVATKTKFRLLFSQEALVQPARLLLERRNLKELLLCGPKLCASGLRVTNQKMRRMTLLTGNAD